MKNRIHTELRGMRQVIYNGKPKIVRTQLPFMVTRGNNIISLSIGDPGGDVLLTVDIKPILTELLQLLQGDID